MTRVDETFDSSSITTPKFFSSRIAYNGVSFTVYWCLVLAVPKLITLHFASLKPNCHWRDHFMRLSRSCCIFSVPSGDFTLRNNLVSSAKIFTVLVTTSGRSFMKNHKQDWAQDTALGIPLRISAHVDILLLTITRCLLFKRKSLTQPNIIPFMPYDSSVLISRWWGTVSNSFLKLRYIASMGAPLSSISNHSSRVVISCVMQDRPGGKPCCGSQNRSCSIICLTERSLTMDSIVFPITDVRLTGL